MNALLGRYLWVLIAAGPFGLACYAVSDWRVCLVDLPAPAMTLMPVPLDVLVGSPTTLQVYTDRGNRIKLLKYPEQAPTSPAMFAAEERWLGESGLSSALTPTAPPTATYVCHDWIFTGGRYSIQEDAAQMILRDNGYQEISVPRPGDLAVYWDAGHSNLMHTGIVHSVTSDNTVFVESKWAWMGRYIHPSSVFANPEAVCSFCRSPRSGHLLRGLDASAPAPSPPSPKG